MGPLRPLGPLAACCPRVLSWWLRRLFESMGHSGSHGPSQAWVCTSVLGVLAGRGFAHQSLAAAGRMEKNLTILQNVINGVGKGWEMEVGGRLIWSRDQNVTKTYLHTI